MQGHQGKRSLLKKLLMSSPWIRVCNCCGALTSFQVDIMSVLPVSDRREHLLVRPCVDERVGLRECQSMLVLVAWDPN
jgi:hypothetical protein